MHLRNHDINPSAFLPCHVDHSRSNASTIEPAMEDICWICRSPETAGEPLACCSGQCSLLAHKSCLLRWQIYSSGKADETQCRFCRAELPDWRAAFPQPRVAPMMSITFNETTYHIQASSQEMFESEVRRLLCLPPDSDLDVTFECRFPGQAGAKLELHGLHTYDTAVFCASAAVATGHLAATSSSSSSSEGASHCSCGDGSSNGMHGGSSDGSSSVWWWSDDDGDDDDGSEERGLLLFSNAISAQLAECADGAVGVVTGALGSMLTRMLA